MSRGGPRRYFGRGGGGFLNFPDWNYGYTLGPPHLIGGYQQFHQPNYGPCFPIRGQDMPERGRPFFRGGGGGIRPTPKQHLPPKPPPAEQPQSSATAEGTAAEKTTLPVPPADAEAKKKPEVAGTALEEGQIEEKPLNDIVRGRHPIVFCNEQAKHRKLSLEWEQVSETGPPHDKTFTYSLKIGNDLVSIGVANSKKGAKSKAAEDMARKLDALQRPASAYWGGGPNNKKRPQFGGTHFQAVQYGGLVKRRKVEEKAAAAAKASEQSPMDKKSQNNPISKLYEYCRQMHLPEPLFETVGEVVLDTIITPKGFKLKKVEFTIQCKVHGKTFMGVSTTKKEAKFNAAAGAWAEFGVGIGQASIASLLQSERDGSSAAAAATTSNNQP